MRRGHPLLRPRNYLRPRAPPSGFATVSTPMHSRRNQAQHKQDGLGLWHRGGVKGLCINTVLAGGAVSLFADFATLFSQPFLQVTTLQIDVASLLSTNHVKCSLRALLVAFANLVRLQVRVCDGRRDIIPLLKERAEPSGACTCPRLEALRINWLCAEDQAFKPRKDAWGLAAPDGEWYRFDPAVFAMFCDIVERMLEHRRSSGAPLKRLAIGVAPGLNAHYIDVVGIDEGS
ncbi:hypothetical protein K466DRAFT_101723 [Polyporus arcularius HHB13444]|uniref:Uncharacterized protein n=1 Tax=Polyporus arcularius HHB13444 TaxID=1314778 RepID=A0A5C3PD92_9APHY|nr:hypothetical protein K466DRAFT_101723 [Polyporus arcularius HHB13444]